MKIDAKDLDAVSRLWYELAEFPASRCEEALDHCLRELTGFVGASNASWVAVTCDSDARPDDPMRGWWPAAIVVLHDADENARRNEATLNQFEVEVVDPQTAAMVARIGTTRALLRAEVMDDAAWDRSWLRQDILRPLGMEDRLVGSFPVTSIAESYFALDRAGDDPPFDDRARDVLHLFLAGCPLFHQEQLRVRGFLDASRWLSPRERSVLELLLTDLSEREIADALGLSYPTTHQYVISVYRRFGVNSRAGLTARWLRYQPRSRTDRPADPPTK